MYSKEEASRVRKSFWTSFGQYLRPIPNAEGANINWINYKTGVRHLYFRMDAEKDLAAVSIEIAHPDEAERLACYQQLQSLQSLLESETGELWDWEPSVIDESGRITGRVGIILEGVNVFNTGDWPAIISFFKPRILAFDRFWSQSRDFFSF